MATCKDVINTVIDNHRHRSNIIFQSNMSTETRLSLLTEMNLQLESVLMKHDCYRGFKYANTDYMKFIQENNNPGTDAYWKLLDQFREYYPQY